MELPHLHLLVKDDFDKVNQLVDKCLHSNISLIPQLAKHLIESGGKRLRPLIVLLSAGAFQYSGNAHISLAATLELIHTATLLHDDVIDTSALRRGKKTANSLWGNPASILVGDFLYSRAFQLMVEINNPRVLKLLADATNTLTQAEIFQLINCHNADLNEEQYLKIIEGKTGILFSIAAQLPAILAGCNETEIKAMANYGLHLGIAFQLIDDTLDYIGTTLHIGKTRGDDLAEGKATLPLIYALNQVEHKNRKQANLIRAAISKGDRKHLNDIIDIIEFTHAIEYTNKHAQAHAKKSILYLKAISNSKYREALSSLAKFSISRTY